MTGISTLESGNIRFAIKETPRDFVSLASIILFRDVNQYFVQKMNFLSTTLLRRISITLGMNRNLKKNYKIKFLLNVFQLYRRDLADSMTIFRIQFMK